MKSICTLRPAKKISKIFICGASLRAGILVMVCLLLPGCMNNMDNSSTAGITLAAISVTSSAGRVLLLLQNPLDIIFINRASVSVASEKADQNNSDNAPTDKQKTNPVQHVPDSTPALADEQHIDVHDQGEEENTIHTAFSRLLRILIMALLVVMMI